jgi:hypothetical protein
MSEGSPVTPQPQVGQQGPAWMRWLDRYAQKHAAIVAQLTPEEDGETATALGYQRLETTVLHDVRNALQLGLTEGV